MRQLKCWTRWVKLSARSYPKNVWTRKLKKGLNQVLSVMVSYCTVQSLCCQSTLHAVKACGQNNWLTNCYEMACKVVRYGLVLNWVAVKYKNLVGRIMIWKDTFKMIVIPHVKSPFMRIVVVLHCVTSQMVLIEQQSIFTSIFCTIGKFRSRHSFWK